MAKPGASLRLVLDTNIIVSGLLWNGAPRQLLDKASEEPGLSLFTSEELIDELRHTLQYQKFERRLSQAGMAIDDAVLLYRGLAEIIAPVPLSGAVPRDSDDDVVAAVAIAAKAHAIISGDKDLTSLEQISSIPVLQAGEALQLIDDRARVRGQGRPRQP